MHDVIALQAHAATAVAFESFVNRSVEGETWTTGGGWLRTKTVHTQVTEIVGLLDLYTHTLKADYPIGIDFIEDVASPGIDIRTQGNLILEGDIESPEHGTIYLQSDRKSVV